jgi:S1-C subfamily serine protease
LRLGDSDEAIGTPVHANGGALGGHSQRDAQRRERPLRAKRQTTSLLRCSCEGDTINFVDGKPVRTPMELAAELADHATGDRVKLGFLIRGQWQSETVILLGK